MLCSNDIYLVKYEGRIKPFTGKGIDQEVKIKPILIKEGEWGGGHCIILKGVTIGKKSILTAGSVVTRDVPDGEIWGGNPVCFISKIE